ncbi:MAG: hypothetical protein RLZZ305_1898 [Actinomycetota bacterium]
MSRRRIVAAVSAFVAAGAAVVLLARDGGGVAVPVFVDETASSGVEHTYDGDFAHFVGGGTAVFDCNDDGRPEIFLAGGTNHSSLWENKSAPGGALSFVRLGSPVTDLPSVTGAYPLDVDSDGALDLVVLRRGATRVLGGLGGCRFEDRTASLGLEGPDAWTVAFSATWEKGNVLPTLAFGNYLVPGNDTKPDGDRYRCADNILRRPEGKRYGAGTALPAHCTLSLLFSDWAGDGRADLRVSNDRNYDRDAREQMWGMNAGSPPREYTEQDGWRRLVIWGMGIASQDLSGDGRPEVFLTSQADNKLQTLEDGAAGPSYTDIALSRGVTAQRPYTGDSPLPSTAWHPEFDDVNNDGLMDLFITKGNVEAQVDYASEDPNNLLLGTRNGRFEEHGLGAGIANGARSRGAALVDLNLDGMLDMVVVNRRVPVEVRRNVGTGTATSPVVTGHWLAVQTRQTGANTFAVGAKVEVRAGGHTTVREVTVGGGHAGGEAGWVHFGLGEETTAELRVTHPGGQPGGWSKVSADTFVVAERGEQPRVWVAGN